MEENRLIAEFMDVKPLIVNDTTTPHGMVDARNED